jgi:hypothetical protein
MISRDKSLIGAHRLSIKLQSHKLVKLARAAGIVLSPKEAYLLDWVSEVVIWKGRYPVPTDSDHAHFFHRLDQTTLESVRACFLTLDNIFNRVRKAFPRHRKKAKFRVMVRLDD